MRKASAVWPTGGADDQPPCACYWRPRQAVHYSGAVHKHVRGKVAAATLLLRANVVCRLNFRAERGSAIEQDNQERDQEAVSSRSLSFRPMFPSPLSWACWKTASMDASAKRHCWLINLFLQFLASTQYL